MGDASFILKKMTCPSCGNELDVEKQLGEKFERQIILAVGLVCVHCGAKIRIERDTPKLDF
jgi:RNase P subunit RPR2